MITSILYKLQKKTDSDQINLKSSTLRQFINMILLKTIPRSYVSMQSWDIGGYVAESYSHSIDFIPHFNQPEWNEQQFFTSRGPGVKTSVNYGWYALHAGNWLKESASWRVVAIAEFRVTVSYESSKSSNMTHSPHIFYRMVQKFDHPMGTIVGRMLFVISWH